MWVIFFFESVQVVAVGVLLALVRQANHLSKMFFFLKKDSGK
jgi:hypothetical protein